MNNYCQGGEHFVGELYVMTCAFCSRTVCRAHVGNPDALAGSLVACVDHVQEVEEMNRQWLERYYADNH